MTGIQLTLKEIAGAVNGVLDNPEQGGMVIHSVTTDSRNVPDGSLFVPIKGEFFDGHNFIDEAFAKGASAALSAAYAAAFRPVIKVDDTRKALLRLASYYIGTLDVKKIGITGSNGKTTTKDIIASVLARRFKTHKTQGNLNNDIGLPLTVLALPRDAEAAVLEMGMNHLGEIRPLSMAVMPDIAVITNIGVAHIENLGSREGILHAKLEILDGLGKNGLALLNGDDSMLNSLKINKNVKYFGLGKNNHYRAGHIRANGIYGTEFTAFFDNTELKIAVPVPGTHMVRNALSAVAAGAELGLSGEEIREGIKNFTGSGGRMEIVKSKAGITVISDAYNANPDSVRAALDVLAQAKGRKMAVLGDMLELGKDAEEMHRQVGEYAAELGIDMVVSVGKLGAYIREGAASGMISSIHFHNKESAAEWLKRGLKEGDTVLVKASNSMRFWEITAAILGE